MATRGTACPPKVLLQLAIDYWITLRSREITSMLCNSNLMDLMHKMLRGNYSDTICKPCCSARHGCKYTSLRRKYLFIMRLYASTERGHTFWYTIPSCTRMYHNSSPAGREVPICIHHINASYQKDQKERGRPIQLSTDRRWRDRTCNGNIISW